MADAKKYLDYVGLSKYDELIKTYIGNQVKTVADRVTPLENLTAGEYKIGDTTYTTIQAYVDAKAAAEADAVSGDLANVKTFIGLDEDGKLSYNEVAKASLADYVNAVAKAEVAEVVGKAPEAFDTLEEIAKWISNDPAGSVTLVNRVVALETSLAEGGATATAIADAKSAADDAQAAADAIYKKDGETESGILVTKLAEVAGSAEDASDRLDVLEGEESVEGSVKAIAKSYANGKDEAIEAAQAAADAAQGDVDALETLVGTIPEDATAETVTAYAKEVADAAKAAAEETAQAANDTLFKAGEGDAEPTGTVVTWVNSKITEVNSAVEDLDLAAVGETGSFIEVVSQEDGQVAATAKAFATALSDTETVAPQAKVVKAYVDDKDDAMNTRVEALETSLADDGETATAIAEAKQAADDAQAAADDAQAAADAAQEAADAIYKKVGETESGVLVTKVSAVEDLIGDVPAKVGETTTSTVVAYVDAKVAEASAAVDALDATVTNVAEGETVAECGVSVTVTEAAGVLTEVTVAVNVISTDDIDDLFKDAGSTT